MQYDNAPALLAKLVVKLSLQRPWCVWDLDVHVRDRLTSGYYTLQSRRVSRGVVGGAVLQILVQNPVLYTTFDYQ